MKKFRQGIGEKTAEYKMDTWFCRGYVALYYSI